MTPPGGLNKVYEGRRRPEVQALNRLVNQEVFFSTTSDTFCGPVRSRSRQKWFSLSFYGLQLVKSIPCLACEQALLFGRAKRVSRERASERQGRDWGSLGSCSPRFPRLINRLNRCVARTAREMHKQEQTGALQDYATSIWNSAAQLMPHSGTQPAFSQIKVL